MTLQFFKKQTTLIEEKFKIWFNSTKQGRTKFCELFDSIIELNSKEDKLASFHNCIGCNIEEGAKVFLNFANKFKNSEDINSYLMIYCLLLYTLAERVIVPYQKITNPRTNFNWKETTPTFYKLKLWANLFKHPKSFMFIHHPSFNFENDQDRPSFDIDLTIDIKFLERYYEKNDYSKNIELEEFLNKKTVGKSIKYRNVQILFPNIVQLTSDFCDEIDKFLLLAKKTENLEKLNEYTIDNF